MVGGAGSLRLEFPPVIVALRRCPAPLAQSAERFHGKEEVVSSILTGGSGLSRLPGSRSRSAGSSGSTIGASRADDTAARVGGSSRNTVA